MRVPGGAPLAWVWGVRGRALSEPRLPALWAGCQGPTTHWLWVRGGAGVGTRHQPHSARSFELALHAVGAARGRPGGGASCLGVGRPGSGAFPLRTARPLGGLPGPTTHWLWVRGVRAWGPVTDPTARASSCWLCALWGRHEGAWGGAPPAWVWGVRGRALSHPGLPALWKEGPYQDRPPLYPFRLSPLLTCSGSTIAFLKILKIQGPNPKI